jgi:hypothetical protein
MFRVFNGEMNETAKGVYFKLVEGGFGSVVLVACDADGKRKPMGNILRITPEGACCLLFGVAVNLGLQLDKSGYIKTVKG